MTMTVEQAIEQLDIATHFRGYERDREAFVVLRSHIEGRVVTDEMALAALDEYYRQSKGLGIETQISRVRRSLQAALGVGK
jgi:hypothetical protein